MVTKGSLSTHTSVPFPLCTHSWTQVIAVYVPPMPACPHHGQQPHASPYWSKGWQKSCHRKDPRPGTHFSYKSMSLVGGIHMAGNTPACLHVATGAECDTSLQGTTEQSWAQEASCSIAGSLSCPRILNRVFNVPTMFALMFQWTLILH